MSSSRRRQSVSRLFQAGLETCQAAGFGWAVVLGGPDYYGWFGFRPARGFGLSDEYGDGSAFQDSESLPGAMPSGAGLVRFAPEFAALA
jgi:putative acetyltransferase